VNSARLHRCLKGVLVGILLLTSMLANAATKEQAVKAGIIYNITKFVIWPSHASSNEEEANLCITSNDDLGGGLEALRGKLVSNKPLVLQRVLNDTNIGGCHILFVSSDDAENMQKILQKIKYLPVFTVSDSPDFINQGGMVGLVRDGRRVGFEVNLKVVKASGLHIGSQLLKLAKKVKGLK
jgi:YfiR/HmsC-like